MEKVWLQKGEIIDRLFPEVDHAFFTDGTWVRRVKEDIHPLHPAAPIKALKGKYNEKLACDIAYVGQMYGTRMKEYETLKERFGDGIKFFEDKYGQDLADLCVSAKVMLIPAFPFDDFYWSDRIYKMISYGGFVIQRRTHGLKEEGFIDGEHYFEYEKDVDFMALMETVLEEGANKMRAKIVSNGKKFIQGHTYEQRIKEMLEITNGKTESK